MLPFHPDTPRCQPPSNHKRSMRVHAHVCVCARVHLSVAAILACLFDQPIKALRRGQIAWTNTLSLLHSLWVSPSPSHTLTILNTHRHTLKHFLVCSCISPITQWLRGVLCYLLRFIFQEWRIHPFSVIRLSVFLFVLETVLHWKLMYYLI